MGRLMLLLPGDKPGPEKFVAARKIIEYLAGEVGYDIEDDLIGGVSIEARGVAITDQAIAHAKKADAILYGCIGGPKWASMPGHTRPAAGLLRLRKELELYANVRPARVFKGLEDASPLKASVIAGLDIVLVRELIGGAYSGVSTGVEMLADGQQRGYDTISYTTNEIRRVARAAFEIARGRSKRVCSVAKAPMLKSNVLWRQEIEKLQKEEFSDIKLSHALPDNVAADLVANPRQFDVLVSENLIGDILTDAAAALTGAVSMLPSASLGDIGPSGFRKGMYEQMHEPAHERGTNEKPKNPLGTVMSLAMLFRHSFNAPAAAAKIENAVTGVVQDGLRTWDMHMPEGARIVTDLEICDAVLGRIRRN